MYLLDVNIFFINVLNKSNVVFISCLFHWDEVSIQLLAPFLQESVGHGEVLLQTIYGKFHIFISMMCQVATSKKHYKILKEVNSVALHFSHPLTTNY